jgi:hypothetical protein
MSSDPEYPPRGEDRRQSERRQSDGPYGGVNRRVAERRSVTDRRAQPAG